MSEPSENATNKPISWMLYGATGYTGPLILEEALKRGHRPVIAGRNEAKLIPLAERYDLEYAVFPLDDVNVVADAIADMEIVYHAAGPFIHTSEPMIRACLATHTHYLDLTGEVDVLEQSYTYDDVARKNGILIMSGAGFDVIPTDCLAKYVADQLPGATSLEIGIWGLSGMSAGTAKSAVEMARFGVRVRRNGQLVSVPIGQGAKRVTFNAGERATMPFPWGDLASAYRTTGIPDITTRFMTPPPLIAAARLTGPLAQVTLGSDGVRRALSGVAERLFQGPSAEAREQGRSYLWAQAQRDSARVEAWMETCEPYQFTALAAVRAVERVADLQPVGALTPALTFGADFPLDICQTRRFDRLP